MQVVRVYFSTGLALQSSFNLNYFFLQQQTSSKYDLKNNTVGLL